MRNKEKFLIEHNKLSSIDLQASYLLLSRFKVEKPHLFKNNDWQIDKLRRPFVFWLTSLTEEQKKKYKK